MNANPSDATVTRAVGEELWRMREARGLARAKVVAKLKSGIGDRTLLSYEHGTRSLTVVRFVEIGDALDADPPTLLAYSLQRARINIRNRVLIVDLNALLKDDTAKFRHMHQWARNALNEMPNGGIVHVDPAVVRNLALFAGFTRTELAEYLAQFLPDEGLIEVSPEHSRKDLWLSRGEIS